MRYLPKNVSSAETGDRRPETGSKALYANIIGSPHKFHLDKGKMTNYTVGAVLQCCHLKSHAVARCA